MYDDLIKDSINAIKNLDKEGNILFIIIYGSYANNTFHKDSDIDLCIYYNDNKIERDRFRLCVLSNINDIFDVHIFQDLPLYIRFDVLKGKIVYHKNKDIYDIFKNTIDEFEDFKRGYYDIINLEKIQ
jgi:hypothetical protein